MKIPLWPRLARLWLLVSFPAKSKPMLRPFQQLRQHRNVDGDAPRLIGRHQIGSGSTTRLVLIVQICERLPAVGTNDEARARCSQSPKADGSVGQAWPPGRGRWRPGAAPRERITFPAFPPQNFLKHSPKWNIFTIPHSTTLLLPSGCTSML